MRGCGVGFSFVYLWGERMGLGCVSAATTWFWCVCACAVWNVGSLDRDLDLLREGGLSCNVFGKVTGVPQTGSQA